MSVGSANWIEDKLAEYSKQGDVVIVHEEHHEPARIESEFKQGLNAGVNIGYRSALEYLDMLRMSKLWSDYERVEFMREHLANRLLELETAKKEKANKPVT